MAECPACNGEKVSCVTGRGICPQCQGVGEVTKERRKAILRVREDLTRRMFERGLL